VAERYGSDRGYGVACYLDGLQSCGRIQEALGLTEEAVAAARSLGNPYWISYALWITGMALSKADVAAFQRAGNVPQLIITLASVPALFQRLDRLAPAAMLLGALSREPSGFHHVPQLSALGDRVSRTLGGRRTAELL
jgi:hypothetical protein